MKKRFLALVLAALMLLTFAPLVMAEEAENANCHLALKNQLINDYHDRSDTRTTLGVGDTIEVFYQGNVPADVYINGEAVHHFDAVEAEQSYVYKIDAKDPVTVSVCTADTEMVNRSFTILSAKDMYRQTLREALDLKSMLETFNEGSKHGLPVGNLFFFPVAFGAQFIYICKVLLAYRKVM